MTVLESIPFAIFCNLVVYAVLCALWGMILLSNKAINIIAGENRPANGSGRAS